MKFSIQDKERIVTAEFDIPDEDVREFLQRALDETEWWRETHETALHQWLADSVKSQFDD